ncbi:arylsulfatase [Polaromonas sp. OV174]|uniref:sulfatase family protein n=1 Tax=Polaromonas sp. OV174 TaxID=1855300 RepID=UPI0008EE30B4|nr:sulfatase-like hydrolase/transferase [Polaromonas sp. OV174]SFC43851.1 arylsulfatase [Polaromonas sp. OV174]
MQPNFLIFVTDQHRADHLGCYGNPVVRTPHIDALASTGWRFNRSYVANPVCMPNRGSMMTGRIPSVHGARGNGVPLPLDSVTYADVLGEFGYRTALIGKSHLQNMEDRAAVLPPEVIEPGSRTPSQFKEAIRGKGDSAPYRQELRSSWSDPAHQLTLPYYGFQDVILCNHHADECFGDYLRWLSLHHPEMIDRLGRENGVRDAGFTAPQAWRTHLSEQQYPTHYIAEKTCEWLHNHSQTNASQPFALMCSFPDPHHPWTPPGRYWDMYDPDAMPVPATAMPDVDKERHVAWLWQERASGKAQLESPRMFAATPREIQEVIALTYGMITNIDDRIGMVMKALKDSGLDRNTVVIFTSDHGDLMGDHGVMLKGPLHYQGLIRVPFIWREPDAAAQGGNVVRNDLVSTIDLAPSILRRANINPPNGVQGKALFSAAGVPQNSGRAAVLVEENQQRAYLGFETPVRMRTVVTQSHRLSVFQEGEWGELYDLVADPDETHNLWDDPSSKELRAQLMEQLVHLLMEHADSSPRPTHLA